MKVNHSRNPASTTSDDNPGLLRRVFRILGLVVVIAIIGAAVMVASQPLGVQKAARDLETRWGYFFKRADAGMWDKWSFALGSYLRGAVDGLPAIPDMVIDVPFDEMRKIYAKRQDALQRGVLVQGPDDFVKGSVRYDGNTVPVKLRLKGDWNDHLAGRKWSFRIRVRDGEQLLGMRRFSIQNPLTRGYQSELMFFELLDRYGVMHPRYQFAQVTLNGDSMGLMAVEEFFAKEMLEFNRRREGVIVRLDESLVWDARDSLTGEPVGWGGAFDHYRNARVDAFGSGKIAKNPVLNKQYKIAAGLLNGFSEGRLRASEVFQVDELGAFLAVSDFLGSWHAVRWHNLRFYLNPISMRLEPVGFDATLQDHYEGEQSVINSEPMNIDMLRDPLVWARYAQVIRELSDDMAAGTLADALLEIEDRYLPTLQTEFRMLGRYPIDYLNERAVALRERVERLEREGVERGLFVNVDNEQRQYPVYAHLGLLQSESRRTLRIETAIPKEVVISAIDWVSPKSGLRQPAVQSRGLPIRMPARGIGSDATRYELELNAPNAGQVLEVTAGIADRNWARQFSVQEIEAALSERPLPTGAIAALQSREFLVINEAARLVEIKAGSWDVRETLIVPPGWYLQAGPGTTLRFATNASLIVNGPLRLLGNSTGPITLLGQNSESWPGLAVMNAGDLSVLRHVRVRDTHSLTLGEWSLTGGVNFYKSDVQIENTSLTGSRGEDALNIIHSEFALTDLEISATASDAFDADFSTGTFTGGRFSDIGSAGGGDAIDVSGSTLEVTGTRFEQVSDKALSVGEGSTLSASGLQMFNIGTGAAAKDGSKLTLNDSVIDSAQFAGLTAYIKKPEYGPAKIVAQAVLIRNTETPVLVQTGNRVMVDDEEMPAVAVDVDALYDTVMKPGLR